MKKLVLLCMAGAMAMLPGIAHAGKGTHVHFAAFLGKGSEYPDVIKGDDIEGPLLQKGAEMMLFAHSASIQDRDVLNLQNDTLRSDENGDFKDYGLNCQVSMLTATDWKVAGFCEVFFTGDSRHKQLIRPTAIPEQLIWYKVFEDKEEGVAAYFMKEFGNVLE